MSFKKTLETWRYPSILLFSIGVSSVGNWVYFIALNLIVLNITESAIAVSGLYIIRALSTLFTNIWSGSLVDRLNKKHLMIALNVFQTVLIALLPFFSSLGFIYGMVFLITIASSMYHSTSVTYTTKLIPTEQRKRFNSLRSLLDSGAFLTGPAIAGMMFTIGTPNMAIYINAAALFLSALITVGMPNVESSAQVEKISETPKLSLKVLKDDWKLVIGFSRKYLYIMMIYLLFSTMIVMMTATDSLEAAFATRILSLSEGEYGVLVSIAGAGVLAGSLSNAIIIEKTPTSWLIGMGSLIIAVGYMVFTSSNTFFIAAVGFFVSSFATAFANTGFYTFYQNNIPVDVMGRVISIYGFIEAFLIIVVTTIFGISSELISIRFAVVSGAFIMFLVSITLFISSVQPSKAKFYSNSSEFKDSFQ
ncbi:MFS transporter [Priestia aryabhattai]|uniref:MFS transporter n=1 Tax=Priestia aryabhattai TaxID=412384 RepID=UPI001CCB656B|nr:MFS transporter [Priestia aryabhattai]MBZ6489455.1 MFS transporter [Priestia aryabhattai]MDH3111136.1 MFS transporter [Priestia aryabhattai]MDH3129804.1 MFS transporter [Priestia aryabhattai]MDH3130282.1 MFS transporter [Priestia aryabhattai]